MKLLFFCGLLATNNAETKRNGFSDLTKIFCYSVCLCVLCVCICTCACVLLVWGCLTGGEVGSKVVADTLEAVGGVVWRTKDVEDTEVCRGN